MPAVEPQQQIGRRVGVAQRRERGERALWEVDRPAGGERNQQLGRAAAQYCRQRCDQRPGVVVIARGRQAAREVQGLREPRDLRELREQIMHRVLRFPALACALPLAFARKALEDVDFLTKRRLVCQQEPAGQPTPVFERLRRRRRQAAALGTGTQQRGDFRRFPRLLQPLGRIPFDRREFGP